MREINKIAESLFEKVRDRFEDVTLGDENAKATQNPEDARFFNFDYSIDGQSFGNITISLVDENSLKVYFSKNISDGLDEEQKTKWYAFLRELREFARRNLLSFDPRDITRSTLKHRDIQQVSKADSTYSKNEVVGESRLYGHTNRSSYENEGPVKIIVRHSAAINPEQRGARSRHIKAVYLETQDGERRKLAHNNLKYARAMARHVSEGGLMEDDFGQHITRIAEECGKLRPFKSQMRRRTFEDAETQEMVEAAFEYHGLLNNTLKKISGRKGYAACKESFHMDEQTLMDDFDVDSMRERFVRKTYNDATDSALPIVQKAYKMKKDNKFAEQFEQWADKISEDSWDDSEDAQQWGEEPINIDDLAELFAEELPIGIDAINATSALRGVINSNDLEDKLVAAAQENPTADARDIILAWVEANEPNVYQELMNEIGDQEPADQYGADTMDEPNMNEDEDDSTDAIANAIIRRILNGCGQGDPRMLALLRKLGPEGVTNAAVDIAEFAGPVQEIGSSDVSGWIAQMERDAGLGNELAEGRMKDVALDIEELSNKQFFAKYKKSKEEMKASLAEGMEDHVNKDEKLKRMGAKPLSLLDKLKTIPQGAKAWAKGDSEDDLQLYNKSKSSLEETSDEKKLERYHELIKQGMDPDDAEVEVFNDEGDEEDGLNEMKRLAGLK